MKEPFVHKTRSGATRQAEYAARMRAEGYRQKTMWLTEDEFQQIYNLLIKLRGGDSHE
jgi:hypothetical protein